MSKILLICTTLTCLLIFMLLSPRIGGYGFISWTWHPVLMLVGVCVFGTVGLFSYDLGKLGTIFGFDLEGSFARSFEDKRRLHTISMSLMGMLVLLGAYIAWYIHEQKDHTHFPSLQKKSVVHLFHVLGGYAFVAFVLFQILGGFYKWWRKIRNPREKAVERHSTIGFHLWSLGMLVIFTGIILPFGKVEAYVSAIIAGTAVAVMYYVVRKKNAQDNEDGYKPVAEKNPDTETSPVVDEIDTTL